MGTNRYSQNAFGATLREAYASAVAEADEEYGHQQGYSGEINNSCGVTDITTKYKNSGKSLNDFMEEIYDKTSKHDPCFAICIKEPKINKNKIKTTVKHIVTPGTKKWVLKYAVVDYIREYKDFLTKGEAVNYARQLAEKNKEQYEVIMKKVLDKGNPLVAKIEYKKSSNEANGKWILFGQASC